MARTRGARGSVPAWAIPAVAGLLAGSLYVREANPMVGGGNSGEFQVLAHLLGIAHPPSYPLYLLLAKAASLLPLPGDVAWRINAITAGLGAAAVWLAGLLTLVLWSPRPRLPPPSQAASGCGGRGARDPNASASPARAGGTSCSRWDGDATAALAAAVAAVAAAAMPRLWTLAVEAEVFTLHLALVLAFWLALAQFQAGPPAAARRWLLLAGLVAGLGLANHRTFLFVAAGGALFVLVTRPWLLTRVRLLAACMALVALGLTPYLYVVRGLVTPVAYFSPTNVHRLSRGEVWYVVQGNASQETGGGEIVGRLFSDQALLAGRSRWLWRHVAGQFGIAGQAVAVVGGLGLLLLLARRPRWTGTALLGAAGAAVFGMAYGKYPDADRYLLPLEALLAIGVGVAVAAAAGGADRLLRGLPGAARVVGALAGLLLGGYWGFSLGVLSGSTSFTRGAYVHHTLHNLQGLERNAVLCTWWASSWGWWYAQFVDGHRPDVTVIPKGPDDCVRDVLPLEFGKRPVYVPAASQGVRESPYVFFPSRDLWQAVAPRAPLVDGALLKGPDEKIYLYEDGQRRWISSIQVFAGRGFTWERVQLTPDYVLRDIPEGPPLSQ